MKNFRMILVVFITVVLLSSAASASNPVRVNKSLSKGSVENLITGVKSDNLGLQLSAMYMLGEHKCSEAVIPLLKMLKSSEREEVRIAAAVALYKIDDARGIFAVRQAVRFDDSDRVKRICSLLCCEYSRPDREKFETFASK